MARANLEVKVFSYAGNATDNTAISSTFALAPRFALVKGGSNIAAFKIRQMGHDATAFLAGSTAHFAGGIKALTGNGFVVGTDAKVNANSTTYYALTIGWADAQSYARAVEYVGNGSDGRQLTGAGLFFQPDFFLTKGNSADACSVRISSMVGDNAWHFSGVADATNELQQFVANGVELGTSTRVNGSGTTYHALGLRNLAGVLTNGTFAGDAVDDRAITHGLGTTPDWIFLKNGTAGNAAIMWTSTMPATQSTQVASSGLTTGLIKSVGATTFTVGSTAAANGSTNTMWWVAGKAGQFNVPLTRTAV